MKSKISLASMLVAICSACLSIFLEDVLFSAAFLLTFLRSLSEFATEHPKQPTPNQVCQCKCQKEDKDESS